MRKPKQKRAKTLLADDQIADCTRHQGRKPIPPGTWDDLIVSDRRGQEWHRAYKERWK